MYFVWAGANILNDICTVNIHTLIFCSNAIDLGLGTTKTAKHEPHMHCYIISHAKVNHIQRVTIYKSATAIMWIFVICFCDVCIQTIFFSFPSSAHTHTHTVNALAIKIQLHDKCCVNTSTFGGSYFFFLLSTISHTYCCYFYVWESKEEKIVHELMFFFSYFVF